MLLLIYLKIGRIKTRNGGDYMKKMFILIIFAFLLASCSFISNNQNVSYNIEMDNLKYNGPFTRNAMPSTGDVKVLVVPINFYSKNKTEDNWQKINLAFNGEKEDVSYHSVKTYYEESSYNKLHLSFDVADWYLPRQGGSYYERCDQDPIVGLNLLITELLTDLNDEFDYRNYDSDDDGYIDALWLVYNKPSSAASDFWWAYTAMSNNSAKWDDKKVKFFSFAPLDSLGDDIDSSTLIHETGHLFGLDDYYSYSDYQNGGLYGYDMMDKNKGDHASISKMLLGWVKPRVVTETGEYSLNSFATSGDVLLVSNHTVTSIYDEYFLIDYYTPDGVNQGQSMFQIGQNPTSGIRVYHVNAKIAFDVHGNVTLGESEFYSTGFKYNNSNETNKFVSLLKANSTLETDIVNNSLSGLYLYTTTSLQFGSTVYQNHKYFDGTIINFSFNVLEIGQQAKISLEVK